jgi:hypothetical protein
MCGFLIASAHAGFPEHRDHQLRHAAGRRGPGEDYRPATHRRYKAVFYKQNGRAASTERRAIRVRVSPENPASAAVPRNQDGTW